MMKLDRPFIYIKVGDKIGELTMNYGYNKEDNNIDSFGFKVETKSFDKGKFEQTLIPGKFLDKETFTESPLKIHFIQVLNIQQIKQDSFYDDRSYVDGFLKASLRIFNQDSETFKDVNLSIMNKGNSPLDFMNLSPLINFINKYIDKNKNVDKLNVEKLIDNSFGYRKPFELHSLITKIKIELFDDSRNRVGKDNYFWTEAILTNLDTNIYFQDQVKTFFERIYRGCRIENNTIIATIESDYGWVPSGTRTQLNNKEVEEEIKIRLSLWLGQHFNYDEYKFKEFENNTDNIRD